MDPLLYKSFAELVFVVRIRPQKMSYPDKLMRAIKSFRRKIKSLS